MKNTIYIQLQTSFDITKKEIPQRIGEFKDFMNRSLGPGFHFLERRLIRILDQNVKTVFGYSGKDFLDGQLGDSVNFEEYVKNLYEFSLSRNS